MQIPNELCIALEKQIIGIKLNELMNNAQNISERYRTESGNGKRLLTRDIEALAYAVVRMPATFGAVFSALEHTRTLYDSTYESLLDVGAGTGAATWAVDSLFNLNNIICLEREVAMRNLGEALMSAGSKVLQDTQWINHNLDSDDIPQKADLVIASYVLNEMCTEARIKAIHKLWNATNKMLLIVEPGTPIGYSHIKDARQELLRSGAHIVAPCPHEDDCKMNQDDWCHFTCRIPRSRLHRQLKNGEVPYEDEKFAYLAVTSENCERSSARVLRHPQISKGKVTLDICTKNGIHKVTISKKEGDLYKCARKANCGDELALIERTDTND